MTWLMSLVPWPWRLLAILGLIGATFGYGWVKGADHVKTDWDADRAHQLAMVDRIRVRQAEATTQVVTQYVDRVRTITQQVDPIIREVPTYVPQDACPVAGAVGVLVTAAEAGTVPDASAAAHAIPTPAADVADWAVRTVEACRLNSEQLIALQAWVTAQAAATR